MRRLAVVAAGLAMFGLAAEEAGAQPTPRCEIHVLRASDAVRAAIEEAIRAEPRCDLSLVVRVIPSEKGLYLLAQSPSGKAFEAVVPDVRAAAAQVAAWSVPASAAPVRVEPAEPLPVAPNDPSVYATPRVRPPGVTPELRDAAPDDGARRNRWFSVGGVVGERTMAARIAIDLTGNRTWSLGIAIQATDMTMVGSEANDASSFGFRDFRTVATAAYTLGTGTTQLRAEVGAGVVHTTLEGRSAFTMGDFQTTGLFPVGEAVLQGSVGLGSRWSASAGPLVTLYSQEYRSATTNEMMVRRDLDITVLAQLRRRL